MVKIRLSRRGTKDRPYYFIVAVDSRRPRESIFLEKLGTYNPLELKEKNVNLKLDRVQHWIERGSKPTHAVKKILSRAQKSQTKDQKETDK